MYGTVHFKTSGMTRWYDQTLCTASTVHCLHLRPKYSATHTGSKCVQNAVIAEF